MKGALAVEIRCGARDGRCRRIIASIGEVFGVLVITDGSRTTPATNDFAFVDPCPYNHDPQTGYMPALQTRPIPMRRDVWEEALVRSATTKTVEVVLWSPEDTDTARSQFGSTFTWDR